ncbi:MAG: triose-phosphate isomerase [Coriobacteriales bacterium]|jgi:triosephosphate isomerase
MGLFDKATVSSRRMPVMAGNWKMNKTTAQAVTLSQNISNESDRAWERVEVVLCPPFTDLKSVFNVLAFDHSDIKLAAQDVYWEDEGAYTGEISPAMLEELHCSYCIVGHSERRGMFGETDETVNKKVKVLIAHKIYPIMCCGEPLEVREAGEALDFVSAQVRAGLDGVEPEQIARSIIAYEPIWAIGTGHTATPEQAQEMCAHIRGIIAEMAGEDAAKQVRILYGGSMKPANADQFLPLEDVDGGLIGGASLDAKSFAELVEMTLKFKK